MPLKALLRQKFIAYNGNIWRSLKLPCVVHTCTSILPLTRRQKSTVTFYTSVHCNQDITVHITEVVQFTSVARTVISSRNSRKHIHNTKHTTTNNQLL